MRYVTLSEVLWLHAQLIEQTGGAADVRDLGALEAAVAQPRATFGGRDLYSGHIEKAAALAFSLVMNHPFVDGNKRIGHAAMTTFLGLNGWSLRHAVDEEERLFLDLAAGRVSRTELVAWLESHVQATE